MKSVEAHFASGSTGGGVGQRGTRTVQHEAIARAAVTKPKKIQRARALAWSVAGSNTWPTLVVVLLVLWDRQPTSSHHARIHQSELC